MQLSVLVFKPHGLILTLVFKQTVTLSWALEVHEGESPDWVGWPRLVIPLIVNTLQDAHCIAAVTGSEHDLIAHDFNLDPACTTAW